MIFGVQLGEMELQTNAKGVKRERREARKNKGGSDTQASKKQKGEEEVST